MASTDSTFEQAACSPVLAWGGPAGTLIAAEGALRGWNRLGRPAVGIEMARLWAPAATSPFACIREHVEETVAVGDPQGDVAEARVILSLIAWDEGRLIEGMDLLRGAVHEVLEVPASAAPQDLIRARWWLATRLAQLGEFTESDAVMCGAVDIVDALSVPVLAAAQAVIRSHIDLHAGRLDAAAIGAQAGFAASHGLKMSLLCGAALRLLAIVSLRRGDLGRAAQYLERCRADSVADPALPVLARCLAVEAQLAYDEDGPCRAIDILAAVYDQLPRGGGFLAEDPAAAAWMVRTALAAGQRTRAASVVAAADQLAAANPGLPTVSAAADHARGLLDQDSARLLRAAATHRHLWARASAAEDAGVVVASKGDSRRAVGLFDRAALIYQQAGAHRDLARVRARRSRVRAARHRCGLNRPRFGWESLTATEQKVADQVAQGLTNRQIAARLFLSPHTVDFHLRQIFRKLDIDSRVKLTRLVLEHQGREHPTENRDALL